MPRALLATTMGSSGHELATRLDPTHQVGFGLVFEGARSSVDDDDDLAVVVDRERRE